MMEPRLTRLFSSVASRGLRFPTCCIMPLAGRYLAGTAGDGNVVRGWQGLLATLQEDQIPDIDYIRFKSGERVFSKSSVSSKDVAEKYVDR